MLDSLPTNGLVIVAKRDCPTCVLVEPVMQSLDRAGPLAVVSQDDPTFPAGVRSVIDDQALERSFRLNIEAVPTLIRFKDGREVERTVGWERNGMDAPGRRRRRRQGPAGVAAGLRLQERRARRARGADRALRRVRAEVARDRRRQLGRSDRSLLRARLERRPAGRAADRRAHPAHAGRHRSQARRGRRPHSAQPRALHRREGGDQRRAGGLQAGIHAGRAGRARGRARSAVRAARPAVHHALLRPAGHHQRPGRQGDRHEQRRQCAGPGQPRQRHDRPRAAADRAQRRRRPARRHRSRDPGQSRQVHLLLRRGRVRSRLGAVVGAPRHCRRARAPSRCSTARA